MHLSRKLCKTASFSRFKRVKEGQNLCSCSHEQLAPIVKKERRQCWCSEAFKGWARSGLQQSPVVCQAILLTINATVPVKSIRRLFSPDSVCQPLKCLRSRHQGKFLIDDQLTKPCRVRSHMSKGDEKRQCQMARQPSCFWAWQQK